MTTQPRTTRPILLPTATILRIYARPRLVEPPDLHDPPPAIVLASYRHRQQRQAWKRALRGLMKRWAVRP
jgi:hypothetical protein